MFICNLSYFKCKHILINLESWHTFFFKRNKCTVIERRIKIKIRKNAPKFSTPPSSSSTLLIYLYHASPVKDASHWLFLCILRSCPIKLSLFFTHTSYCNDSRFLIGQGATAIAKILVPKTIDTPSPKKPGLSNAWSPSHNFGAPSRLMWTALRSMLKGNYIVFI